MTLLAVATIALSSLTVFDFWWYLASGQRILETRAVPATDPFSYTAEGRPWINHMWATQVLFTLLWERWGRLALIGLKTVTVVATFGVVLGDDARPRRPPAPGVGGDAAGGVDRRRVLACAAPDLHVPVRGGPDLAPAPGVGAPPRHADPRARARVPWVNLHAGFVMAFLVIGVAGLGTALPLLVDPRAGPPDGAWSGSRRSSGWRRPPPAC